MKNNVKILLTGGGSGGHAFPTLAVARQLSHDCREKNLNCRLWYFGSFSGPERKLVKEYGLKYYPVFTGKWRRYISFWNLVDVFKIILGFFQTIILLLWFWPDVIFAKGGYVTLPVVFAAWILRRPIVSHESDIILGASNKIEANLVNKICVSFPLDVYKKLPVGKAVYTGNPVRQEFLEKRKEVEDKHLLVFGGSQGAHKINELVAQIAPKLSQTIKIIHICGQEDYAEFSKKSNESYEVHAFIKDIALVMAQSKLIISRAGANSITEILTLGKPSILIPLPSAASSHQLKNATYIQERGAAVCIDEEKLTENQLLDIIERILNDKSVLQKMSLAARNLTRPQAASLISKEILNQIRR